MKMHTLMDALDKLDEVEAELRGAQSTRQHVKTSSKKKNRGLFDWFSDDDLDHDVQVSQPLVAVGESDKDLENREDSVLFNPGDFNFVSRSVGWEDHQDAPSKDRDLILRYQQEKNPHDLETIYARNKDFLDQQVWSMTQFRLPKPALQGLVYNNFKKAVDNWKPEKKANIRTFYKGNYRQNLMRDARQAAQFTRAERGRVAKVERVRQLEHNLELEKGYVPTADEIVNAANPGELKVKDVKIIFQEARGDLLGSRKLDADHDIDMERAVMMAVRRVRDYYGGRKKKALNHIFGLDGVDYIASNKKLAKKFGITEPQMSVLKRQFRQDIQKEMQILGF